MMIFGVLTVATVAAGPVESPPSMYAGFLFPLQTGAPALLRVRHSRSYASLEAYGRLNTDLVKMSTSSAPSDPPNTLLKVLLYPAIGAAAGALISPIIGYSIAAAASPSGTPPSYDGSSAAKAGFIIGAVVGLIAALGG